ncbi:hypothetical protein NDU88_006204 [Pleurodeles waltl]|uniref:Uncharacterized protein n=1 Tax=Pleurodeles waltl TaxID=8319 RepID=A0AAV7UNA0_PLEWA|nr:hypothetical protein NDU88_006204 [Pleurodeles waltl]
MPRYSWEGSTGNTNCLCLLKTGYNQGTKCPGSPPSHQTNNVTVSADPRLLRRHSSKASPKNAEGEFQVPSAGSRTKCTKACGGNPLPAQIPPVDLAVAGGTKQTRKQQAKKPPQLSRAQTGGRSAHDPNRAMLGVSPPSDGSSRAAH